MSFNRPNPSDSKFDTESAISGVRNALVSNIYRQNSAHEPSLERIFFPGIFAGAVRFELCLRKEISDFRSPIAVRDVTLKTRESRFKEPQEWQVGVLNVKFSRGINAPRDIKLPVSCARISRETVGKHGLADLDPETRSIAEALLFAGQEIWVFRIAGVKDREDVRVAQGRLKVVSAASGWHFRPKKQKGRDDE